ncbi:MAG TPA: hypothetical protein VE974_12715 [Thermoanaerobaculia bacterium]|nr:hypothetical protein [Thermoanaerobaculia bacterium]
MAREKLSGATDIAGRWISAAVELNGLLEENDALLEQRARLGRKRAELFRAIVEEARTFVEHVNVPPLRER